MEFAALVSQRTLLMADGELIAEGPTADLLVSSPAYAPQLAKVFAPIPVLTPGDVVRGLAVSLPVVGATGTASVGSTGSSAGEPS